MAEYGSTGTLLRRYVHGAAVDDAVVWYEGAVTTSPRYLHSNHQGSVVAVTDSTGNATAINSYDEWGIPSPLNQGRFQYTGQAWIPELKMYYYKARIYSPTLGRFLQTDPIGYEDQINLYAYVGNDPVNNTDPTGESTCADKNCSMSFIDPMPAGEDGPTITFRNDDPNGASPNLPVTTEMAKMVEAAVIESDVNEVNINSTSGGKHSPTSRHSSGRAVDINEVNGEKVLDQGASEPVQSLQEAFSEQENIRENFGPSSNTKVQVPGGNAVQWPSVAKAHRNHIHVSGQR